MNTKDMLTRCIAYVDKMHSLCGVTAFGTAAATIFSNFKLNNLAVMFRTKIT